MNRVGNRADPPAQVHTSKLRDVQMNTYASRVSSITIFGGRFDHLGQNQGGESTEGEGVQVERKLGSS